MHALNMFPVVGVLINALVLGHGTQEPPTHNEAHHQSGCQLSLGTRTMASLFQRNQRMERYRRTMTVSVFPGRFFVNPDGCSCENHNAVLIRFHIDCTLRPRWLTNVGNGWWHLLTWRWNPMRKYLQCHVCRCCSLSVSSTGQHLVSSAKLVWANSILDAFINHLHPFSNHSLTINSPLTHHFHPLAKH